MSPVSIVPPGSAVATTIASTADPFRAAARRAAARRARCWGRSSRSSQILRNRLVSAPVRWRPLRHSTRTTEGTSGGQIPSSLRTEMIAAASWLCRESRLTPPESRTSWLKRSERQHLAGGPAVTVPRLASCRQNLARQPLRRAPRGSGRSRQGVPGGGAPPVRPAARDQTLGALAPSQRDGDRQEGRPASGAYAYYTPPDPQDIDFAFAEDLVGDVVPIDCGVPTLGSLAHDAHSLPPVFGAIQVPTFVRQYAARSFSCAERPTPAYWGMGCAYSSALKADSSTRFGRGLDARWTDPEVEVPVPSEMACEPGHMRQPQRGSNPCLHLERVVSLAARRWGPTDSSSPGREEPSELGGEDSNPQ